MNVPTHYTSPKHFLGRKKMGMKILKSTLDRVLACAKRIPALMNLWVTTVI
jgi:hypothetical protein